MGERDGCMGIIHAAFSGEVVNLCSRFALIVCADAKRYAGVPKIRLHKVVDIQLETLVNHTVKDFFNHKNNFKATLVYIKLLLSKLVLIPT